MIGLIFKGIRQAEKKASSPSSLGKRRLAAAAAAAAEALQSSGTNEQRHGSRLRRPDAVVQVCVCDLAENSQLDVRWQATIERRAVGGSSLTATYDSQAEQTSGSTSEPLSGWEI